MCFENDAEYIDEELRWLAIRMARRHLELKLHEAGWAGKGQMHEPDPCRILLDRTGLGRRILAMIERERDARTSIDGRLEMHRKDPSLPRIGLDRVCRTHNLTEDDRTLLLACAVPGIGPQHVLEVFGRERGYLVDMIEVHEAMAALDPQNTRQWIQARSRLFPEAPLVSFGLVNLFGPADPNKPAGLLHQGVCISVGALMDITGEEVVAGVGEIEEPY